MANSRFGSATIYGMLAELIDRRDLLDDKKVLTFKLLTLLPADMQSIAKFQNVLINKNLKNLQVKLVASKKVHVIIWEYAYPCNSIATDKILFDLTSEIRTYDNCYRMQFAKDSTVFDLMWSTISDVGKVVSVNVSTNTIYMYADDLLTSDIAKQAKEIA